MHLLKKMIYFEILPFTFHVAPFWILPICGLNHPEKSATCIGHYPIWWYRSVMMYPKMSGVMGSLRGIPSLSKTILHFRIDNISKSKSSQSFNYWVNDMGIVSWVPWRTWQVVWRGTWWVMLCERGCIESVMKWKWGTCVDSTITSWSRQRFIASLKRAVKWFFMVWWFGSGLSFLN